MQEIWTRKKCLLWLDIFGSWTSKFGFSLSMAHRETWTEKLTIPKVDLVSKKVTVQAFYQHTKITQF